MLASKKLLTRNAHSLSSLIGFTVFCYIYFRYDWNNFLSLVLCGALAGGIAFGWDREIERARDEQKGLPVALSGRWWWAVCFINIFVLTWLIVWDLAFLTYAEIVTIALAVAILLGYLAWIEWTYKKEGRSFLFGVSAFLWLLFALLTFAQAISASRSQYQSPTHSSGTDLVLGFAFLGFYILPFLWFFLDTLRKKDTLRALASGQAVEHSRPVLDETEKTLRGLTSKFEANRVDAAKGLGQLQDSNDRIIKALIIATNDEYQSVKRTARAALDAPQHQSFMKTRPEYQRYVNEA
jgi:hypothetical protein